MTLLSVSGRRRSSGFEPDNGFTYPLPSTSTVVTVPTYDGSGKSMHPSVVDMGQRWNGYRWWFVDTPYPVVENYQQYENPSIFASNDRTVWEVPAGASNPLVPPPVGGNHSDPELTWDPDGKRLVLHWREEVPTRTPRYILRCMWSRNGITWHEADSYNLNPPSYETLSPTVCRVGPGEWRMWRFGYTRSMVMFTATGPFGPWTLANSCTFSGVSAWNWHGDIIRHADAWLGIMSDKSDAFPLASIDGVAWTVGNSLGITSYRPTFTPSTEPGELDIWTSSMSRNIRYHRRPLALWTDLLP